MVLLWCCCCYCCRCVCVCVRDDMVCVYSQGDIARRISRQRVTLTPFETPDIAVTESEFELPIEEAKERELALKPMIEKRAVSKHTEVMRASVTHTTTTITCSIVSTYNRLQA